MVIGWKHRAFARNIHLTVQSTSKPRPTPEAVDTHHLLMTRNQAMLLANYLMRVTGQEPPSAAAACGKGCSAEHLVNL